MSFCENCQASYLADDDIFCDSCGIRLPHSNQFEMMSIGICENCQTKYMGKENIFCDYCGIRLSDWECPELINLKIGMNITVPNKSDTASLTPKPTVPRKVKSKPAIRYEKIHNMSRQTIESHVENIFARKNGRTLLGSSSIYVTGDIPQKKLSNFTAKITNLKREMRPDEFPLLFIDNTFFGSGKEGTLLTKYALYRKESFSEVVQLDVGIISGVSHIYDGSNKAEQQKLIIHTKDGNVDCSVIMLCGTEMQKYKGVVTILNALLELLKQGIPTSEETYDSYSPLSKETTVIRERTDVSTSKQQGVSGVVAKNMGKYGSASGMNRYEIESQIEKIFINTIRNKNMKDTGLYSAKKIPQKKLTNFVSGIQSISALRSDEIPLLFIDFTTFGSGKNGVLFTNYALYVKNNGASNVTTVHINTITGFRYKDAGIAIKTANVETIMNIPASVGSFKVLKDIFSDIFTFITQ